MPPLAERAAWALVAVGALTVPLVALIAAGVLVVGRLVHEPAAAAGRLRRLLTVWPLPLWIAVVALVAVHAAQGAAWWDLAGLLAWASALAMVRPLHDRAARDGVLVGVAAAVSIQLVAALPGFVGWVAGEAAGRWAGTTPHPNLLAAAMLLAAATLAVAAHGERGWRRAVAVPTLVVALGLALASGSRSAVVGAAISAAVWAVGALVAGRGATDSGGCRDRSRALLVLLVTVVAPLAVAGVRGLPVADLLVSDVERAAVFSISLDLSAARPLFGHGGVGWDDLVTSAEPSLPTGLYTHAHAVAWHLLVRGGALGLALAALLVGLALRALLGRVGPLANLTGLAAPLLVAAAGGLGAQAFVDLVVVDPAVYLNVAALVAVLLTLPRRYHPP